MNRNLPLTLLLGALGAALAAGPPFRTDDPEPVELGHLEWYVFSAGQHLPGASSGFGPALEFNYGILPEAHFHVIVPYAYDRTRGLPAQGGLGDAEVGIKFRFLAETAVLPQVGFYPMMELPTGNPDRRLGAGHTQVFLPLWLQKSWGPWTSYGGHGWWRNPGPGNRNWTFTGWLLQRALGETATLGGEVFRTTAQTLGGRAATGCNLGGQVNLSPKHHLLLSAGRNVSGAAQTSFYVGYQFTTGTYGNLRDWFSRSRP